MRPDYRKLFIEELETQRKHCGVVLEKIRTTPRQAERNSLVLMLRMFNAEVLKYRAAVDVIDGRLSEKDFFRWHVAEEDKRRRRLLFIRDLMNDNTEDFTPAQQSEFDGLREMIRIELAEQTHYSDQISACWEDIEARR